MNRAFHPIAVVLCAALSLAACSAVTYRFPISKTAGPAGGPLYVEDARLRALIPGIAAAGERRATCANSMIFPPPLWLTFGPTVTGPHEARLVSLACSFESQEALRDMQGSIVCGPPHAETVAFADDPSRFYRIGAGVDPAQARDLYRALMAGELEFASGVQKPAVADIEDVAISREKGRLVLRWGDCGCTSSLSVEVRGSGPAYAFRATQLDALCI